VRRTRARTGQVGPRTHQRRLQCRRPEHAVARKSKAHCSGNVASSHARALDT
jgi:hypothetical protein